MTPPVKTPVKTGAARWVCDCGGIEVRATPPATYPYADDSPDVQCNSCGTYVKPAPAAPEWTCSECGIDLTPTQPQLDALVRWGNPIRRQPCLETESGLHRVVPAPAAEREPRV